MISKGNDAKFAPLPLLTITEEAKHDFFCFVQCIIKKIITFRFCDIQNNQSLGYQPQASALAENPYLDLDYSGSPKPHRIFFFIISKESICCVCLVCYMYIIWNCINIKQSLHDHLIQIKTMEKDPLVLICKWWPRPLSGGDCLIGQNYFGSTVFFGTW